MPKNGAVTKPFQQKISNFERKMNTMSHPIYPHNRDESVSSDGLRSCESGSLYNNDQVRVTIKPDPYLGELSGSTDITATEMSLTVLTEYCVSEIKRYRDGEMQHDTYFVELLRRATLQGNQDAWELVKHCLSTVVREWLVHHPKGGVWYQLESEEEYIAEVFARFYEATVERHVEIDQLSIALRYLQACLNSTLLDKRRDSTPLSEIPMWEQKNSGELAAFDLASDELWETLRNMLPNTREQRLAYLLFHCALKPKEIVHLFPREFQDVQEINVLRASIIVLLLNCIEQSRGGEL
jgi:hypothetical protein